MMLILVRRIKTAVELFGKVSELQNIKRISRISREPKHFSSLILLIWSHLPIGPINRNECLVEVEVDKLN
jgi:hypothetical protein